MEIQKILVSQPAPTTEKNPFSDIAEKHKVSIDFRPLVNIEGVSLKEFRAQRTEILDHTAVIFTSKSSIDHFFAVAEQARITIPESMKYFCTTEVIALYMQKYIVYRKRKVFFGKATFSDLMEIIVKHKDLKYMLPLCENHKPEMPQALTRAGINFSKVIISHPVAADMSDVNPMDYQMIVCYSPADVNVMVSEILSKNTDCKIAAFGNTTACAVFEQDRTIDIAVPMPGMPSMTMAIDKYLDALSKGKDIEVFAMRTAPKKSEPSVACVKKRTTSTSITRKTTK